MDAQARNKALFRAKLNAQKKEKRIDSPLVRYNDSDQPVCRVCDVVLKSESNWDAHQASRKHHEAIANLKANVAGSKQASSTRSQPNVAADKLNQTVVQTAKHGALTKGASSQTRPVETSYSKNDVDRPHGGTVTLKKNTQQIQRSTAIADNEVKQVNKALPAGFFEKDVAHLPDNGNKLAREHVQASGPASAPETKQVKGALPEGFFDNKEADLRARGIKPVKIDVKDEYKEFEKLIQEDLQEVDNRMGEEEIDAAEMIEEAESLEQKTYNERVELLKKRKVELKASRSAKHVKVAKDQSKDLSSEESSSDSDPDDNFAVDWRAQHL